MTSVHISGTTGWRMLPPGGAPLPLSAIAKGLLRSREGSALLDAFRDALASRFNSRHVFFAGSGRAGLSSLFAALRRLSPERNEVLIPAYVSFSVPSAVVHAGCRVSLYDIDPLTLTPRYESLDDVLSERTLAVVACHQFGLPFALEQMASMCRQAGAFFVDDAAQAMGGMVGKRYVGTLGDAGIFSLSRGKPMTAIEGGIVLCNEQGIAESMRSVLPKADSINLSLPQLAKALALSLLRNPSLYRVPASLPWLQLGASIFEPDFDEGHFSSFQASLGLQALESLERVNGERSRKADMYRKALQGRTGITLIPAEPDSKPVCLRFPIVSESLGTSFGRMPTLRRRLATLGISKGFPLSLDAIPALQGHIASLHGSGYPGARYLADNLFTLPTHEYVREADCGRVAACIAEAASSGAVEEKAV